MSDRDHFISKINPVPNLMSCMFRAEVLLPDVCDVHSWKGRSLLDRILHLYFTSPQAQSFLMSRGIALNHIHHVPKR